MGLSYEYDDRVVILRLAGDYRTDELRDVILQSLDDARCPESPVLLCDLRQSAAIEGRSREDVQETASFFVSVAPRYSRRIAMVTGSDVAFGLMRMGSVFANQGGTQSAVFRDLDRARAWLLSDTPPPEVD